MPNLTAPEPYILWLTGAGVLIALAVWLPPALRRLPLSFPIICIGLGAAIFSIPGVDLVPLPLRYPAVTERFTEFVVIIALMGAGLKIDRVFSWRRWNVTWRLLGIAMPLSIAAITAMGGLLLGLPWVTALLLGAALAPTDPVLASDVQVGPPKSGEEDEVRFGLTSEAGLNDGLAFPFVNLACHGNGKAVACRLDPARCAVGNRYRHRGGLGHRQTVWVADFSCPDRIELGTNR